MRGSAWQRRKSKTMRSPMPSAAGRMPQERVPHLERAGSGTSASKASKRSRPKGRSIGRIQPRRVSRTSGGWDGRVRIVALADKTPPLVITHGGFVQPVVFSHSATAPRVETIAASLVECRDRGARRHGRPWRRGGLDFARRSMGPERFQTAARIWDTATVTP